MKRKAKSGNPGGFTLVEMMISLAITAILVLALVGAFRSQQISYNQQTDLSKSQANARAALYQMSRDIRMAGYTGIALGVDALAGSSTPLYPIIPLKSGGTLIAAPAASQAAAATLPSDGGDEGDAIEIWGNFIRASATLDDDAEAPDTEITVDSTSMFPASGFNHPGWVVIGNSTKTVELHTLVSASGTQITLGEPLEHTFLHGETMVSPLFRRLYYVDRSRVEQGQPLPTLYMANCLPTGCNLGGAIELGINIDHLNISYDVTTNTSGTAMTNGLATTCNPCFIRTVKIELRTVSSKLQNPNRPIYRLFSTAIRVRNIGFDVKSCVIDGC